MKNTFLKMNNITRATLVISVLALVANVVARCSSAFSDWYIGSLYQMTVNIYARITGVFPFSLGEIMIILAIIYCVSMIIFLVGGLVAKISGKTNKLSCLLPSYARIFLFVLSVVFFVMTFNCFILYQGSGFGEKYIEVKSEYTVDEIVSLRNKIAEKCNELSALQKRDEKGQIIYDGDIRDEVHNAMTSLGKTYPELSGFYPKVKYIKNSDFMSQQYVSGIFFPFSMEANVNGNMYLPNYPATMCHELAHIKGYIYEDEANFIAYLACINSDDVFFQYSGYLSVLYYVEDACYESIGNNWEDYELTELLDVVYEDNIFLTQETWEDVEDDAIIDTEIVEDIADITIDTSLKVNGVEDGIVSYSRVVELMLGYEGME